MASENTDDAAALDAARTALFAAPFAKFTEARAALVKGLRENASPAAARELGKTRRPTRGAWALNQLARRDPKTIEEFVTRAARDHQEQLRAVKARDASGIHAAARSMNESVAHVAALASKIVAEDGAQVSAALSRTIVATLRAIPLAAGEDVQRFQRGMLVVDLDAPDGLAPFSGEGAEEVDEPPSASARGHAPRSAAKDDEPPVRAAAVAKAKAKADREAREEAKRAKEAEAKWERQLAALKGAAQEAEREAARLGRAAKAAAERAREAEGEASAARAEAERAQKAVEAAGGGKR